MKFPRFRFGLRILLIVFALVACVCVVVGNNYRQHRNDLKIVSQLELSTFNLGGARGYSFDAPEETQPDFFEMVTRRFEFFPRIKKVAIGKLDASSLELLCRLDQLRELQIYNWGSDENDIDILDGLNAFRNLRHATFNGLNRVEALGGLVRCRKLEKLNLIDCGNFYDLAGLRSFSNLMEFTCCNSKRLVDISEVSHLPWLKVIALDGCSEITDFSAIRGLQGLEEVSLGKTSIRDIDFLFEISGLRKLRVAGSKQLGSVGGVSPTNQVLELDFTGCWSLETFDFAGFPQLENVRFKDSRLLERIESSAANSTVTAVTLNDCPRVIEFSWINNFQNLNQLASDAPVPLAILQQLKQLKTVAVCHCNERHIIEALADHHALEVLYLEECSNVVGLDGISKLPKLKELIIDGCRSLVDLSAASKLENLERVWIDECDALADINVLAGLPSLSRFYCFACPQVSDASAFLEASQSGGLALDLRGCPADQERALLQKEDDAKKNAVAKIQKAERFSAYTFSRENDLTCEDLVGSIEPGQGSVALENLPRLSNLDCLLASKEIRAITIKGCPEIVSLPAELDTANLRELRIANCEKFAALPPFSAMPKLQTLSILDCPAMVERCQWKDLKFGSIGVLEMSHGFADANLLHLNDLPAVNAGNGNLGIFNLTIRSCSLPEFTDLRWLPPFQYRLKLHSCEHLRNLQGMTKQFAEPDQGNWVEIMDCKNLEGLDGIEILPRLKGFKLVNCDRVKSFKPLANADLSNLSDLKIDAPTTRLVENSINQLLSSKLPRLERLSLSGLSSTSILQELKFGATVNELELVNCDVLVNLDFLFSHQRGNFFKQIRIINAANLKNVDALSSMLCKKVEVVDCPKISVEAIEKVKREWPLRKLSERSHDY